MVACPVAADLLTCAGKPAVAADDSVPAVSDAAVDFGAAWADCKKHLAETRDVLAECAKKVASHGQ